MLSALILDINVFNVFAVFVCIECVMDWSWFLNIRIYDEDLVTLILETIISHNPSTMKLIGCDIVI